MTRSFHGFAVLLIIVAAGAPTVFGQDGDAPAAVTAADPGIAVAELKLRLLPLFKDELEIEADAWKTLLRKKVEEISEAELAVRGAEGAEGGEAEAHSARSTQLQLERGELLTRLRTVTTALEAKGGDPKDLTAYADAVSGLQISTKDASALWTTVSTWAKSREGGLKWAKNIGLFIGTIIAFVILARILGGLVRRGLDRFGKTSELLRTFLVNITRKSTFVVGVVVAISMLGVNIGPLVAAIGAAGFVVGFALQGTLSNFASGVMILLYRPYDVGNVITVGSTTGKVEAMTLVSTTILTPDNQRIIVPNNSIWGGVITNVTGNATRRVDLTFGIGYDDDPERAAQILEEIVNAHELVLETPEPVIRLHALADSSVNFVVRPWAQTSDYWDVYWDVTRTVKKRFDEEGISIPYPQRDVHLHGAAGA